MDKLKLHTSIFFFFFFVLISNESVAQKKRLSKGTSQALNNYLIYSNEAVYGINIMYTDFLKINKKFNKYLAGDTTEIKYEKEEILTNYEYFPVYPKELFERIKEDNIYIPYSKRKEPLELVGKVSSVLSEINTTRNSLCKYIKSNEYKNDSILGKGYKLLKRIEVLYYDIFTLQEKLHWSLHAIIREYTHTQIDNNFLILINELQPLIGQNKLIIKSIRAKDTSSSLAYNITKLADLVRLLQTKKTLLFSNIPANTNALNSPQNRFVQILAKSKQILATAQSYHNNPKYKGLEHLPSYYYYNNELLSAYNRYGDGVVTLFNKMIDNSSIYWLREHEMPFLFEVVYPDIPAYADQQIDSLPDPEEFIKKIMAERALKDSIKIALQDSIIADSIAKKEVTPVLEKPSLNGFATNNLIFLLDISSSMNDEDKLPLLKEAMRYLLEFMRKEDNITLITYSTKAELILPTTSATEIEKILAAIDNLKTKGVSNANKGIDLAYDIVDENYIKGGNNRIILATDGGFKLQKNLQQKIKHSAKKTTKKICMSVFYFSQKEFEHNKIFLEKIANLGQGKYSYIQRANAKKTLLIEAQAVRQK